MYLQILDYKLNVLVIMMEVGGQNNTSSNTMYKYKRKISTKALGKRP